MSSAQISGEAVLLRPVERGVARTLLGGDRPAGIDFADGYPSPFSLEVMDLLAGPRSASVQSFNPWFVVRAHDEVVIGEIGYSFDEESATASLGYALVEPCWGHGHATDALRALIAHLRGDPRVRRLTSQTPVGHVASRRVMEKAGMLLSDERLGDLDGEMVEMAIYEA